MGDIELEIDIEGEDRVAPALSSGLKSGLEDAGNWMLDEGENKAKDVVMLSERVWRGTVKQGFSTSENSFNRYYRWKGKIENDAPHAGIVERGLKPGSNPEVQDIIPWVDAKLVPDGDTQEKAAEADVGEWNPELEALAGRYSPALVLTAFAVKGKLENEGYPGIGFMETTEQYLEQVGPRLVKQKVEKHMRRELRAAGLK
jgi:hypothetical protein